MANSTITFFPVGEKNGGMTLIRLNDQNNTTILIDCSIEAEPIAESCNVNQELRNRLPSDEFNRPYVDAFILTHRHEDHLNGFSE
jgi:phosphoribosyl 1,2-cyclic phosphodiesterase